MLWSQATFHRGPVKTISPVRMFLCSLGPNPAAIGGKFSSNSLLEVLVPRNSRVNIQFLYGSDFFFFKE
jgi:hypothetical protein